MLKKIVVIGLAAFLLCAGQILLPGQASKAWAAPKVVIKVAHVEAEDRSTHKALLKLKEFVEKESKGEMEMQIFPNGLLGGDKESIEAVELGTVQMTLPATSVLVAYDPKFGLLDMPFLFKNEKAVFAAMDGDVGKKFNEILDKFGLMSLGYSYNGSRSMSNNVRPINEPNDLKGVKMRVMESPVYIDMFNALGANPTPMNFGEVFTGLQQGTVSGQENAPSLTYAMKFYEVQKYYSLTNHTVSMLPVLISKDYFESLSPEHQKILKEGVDMFVKTQRQMEIDETAGYIEKLKQGGMQINEITPENHEKFVQAVKPVYDKNVPLIGEEMFKLVEKYNQEN